MFKWFLLAFPAFFLRFRQYNGKLGTVLLFLIQQ